MNTRTEPMRNKRLGFYFLKRNVSFHLEVKKKKHNKKPKTTSLWARFCGVKICFFLSKNPNSLRWSNLSLSLLARCSWNGWHSTSMITIAATGNSLYFLSKVRIVSLESSSLNIYIYIFQNFDFIGRLSESRVIIEH